jgi:hypothetical protein
VPEEQKEITEKIELTVATPPADDIARAVAPSTPAPSGPASSGPVDNDTVIHGMLHNAPMAQQCTSNWEEMSGDYCRQCLKCGLGVFDFNDPRCPPIERLLLKLRTNDRYRTAPLFRRGDGRFVQGDCFAKRNAGVAYAAFMIGTVSIGASFYGRTPVLPPALPCTWVLVTLLILWSGLGNYLLTRTANPWKIALVVCVFMLPIPAVPLLLLTPWALPIAQFLTAISQIIPVPEALNMVPPLLAWLFFLWLIILKNPSLTRFDRE